MPKSRCGFLHLDLGNTEVVPWGLGFFSPMSGCRNLHVDIGNSFTIIFYHDFSGLGFGVLHLRFMPKEYFLADLLARGTPSPSPPQIRCITIFYFVFYLSTQPKKHICTMIEW